MTEFLYANNASTTLAGAISATATSVSVAAGTGAKFPSPVAGQAFSLTFVDAATGLINEITYCTTRSGDTLTISRGQEGTTAQAWSAGDVAANFLTALAIQQFQVGFTPVQQGGGASQQGNKIYLGWDGSGLRLQVDNTDEGELASASSLTAETNRAQTAEGTLYNEIQTEIGRAQGAEGTLYGEIQSEIARAEAAEGLLAPLKSPAFSGDPHVPTPGAGNATPSITNCYWVSQYYLALVGGTLNGALVVNGGVTVQGGASLNVSGAGQVNSVGAISQNGPSGSGWSGNVSSGYNPIVSQQTGVYLSQAVYAFNGGAACGYFGTGAGGGHIFELFNSKGGVIGSIANSGDTGVTFNTTSDYRLKENIEPLSGEEALAVIEQLKAVGFDFVGQPDSRTYGFIAHDLAKIVPAAVTGAKDATRTVVVGTVEDGAHDGPPTLRTEERILPQGVDLTRLVPYLVASVACLGARMRAAEERAEKLTAGQAS